jgi:hypothetical protein
MIAGIVVLMTIMLYVFARAAEHVWLNARKEDVERQELIAKVLLDQIGEVRALVNHRLTEVMKAQLVALEGQAIVMTYVEHPPDEIRELMTVTMKRVTELKVELLTREEQEEEILRQRKSNELRPT